MENVPLSTTLGCGEVFGPVVVLQRYDSFDEAISIA